jgi:protocatechuate 3,4-dioxygenase beta subunit
LAPEETQGPYYIQSSQVRQDITDGKKGLPLDIELTIVNGNTCQPIANAMVDLWHADAEGLYSAYPGQGDNRTIDNSRETFLRGVQVTGSDGKVTFKTIYPGWYRGRTTHVHFNNNTLVTSQLYFPEDVNQTAYTSALYKVRGQKDTPNASDMVYLPTNMGERTVLKMQKQGEAYQASLTVGASVK